MSVTISIRLDDDVVTELDLLAKSTERTRNYWLNRAVRQLLDGEGAQISLLKRRLESARAGNLATDAEVKAFLDAHTTPGARAWAVDHGVEDAATGT